MIKINAKFNKETENFKISYVAKNSFTLENLCVIENICQHILENDENMTIEDIFELVKLIKKEREKK